MNGQDLVAVVDPVVREVDVRGAVRLGARADQHEICAEALLTGSGGDGYRVRVDQFAATVQVANVVVGKVLAEGA